MADIVNSLKLHDKQISYSLEFFVPKSADAVDALTKRMLMFQTIDLKNIIGPCFLDLTWGAGGAVGANNATLLLANDWSIY